MIVADGSRLTPIIKALLTEYMAELDHDFFLMMKPAVLKPPAFAETERGRLRENLVRRPGDNNPRTL